MQGEIGLLEGEGARREIPALAAILQDCVANGASLGFMAWNTLADYQTYFEAVVADVAAGRVLLLAARDETGIVGTAQLHLIAKPNQPHRAEIAKVLVHSRARRRGLGAALVQQAEALALRHGRNLLVLDTDEDSPARQLYARLGWTRVGTIPRYALMPDGRDCASTFFYKELV